MKGEVRIDSEINKGTSFKIEIPITGTFHQNDILEHQKGFINA
jgi:chemotaxis protein histidine kinase CheA